VKEKEASQSSCGLPTREGRFLLFVHCFSLSGIITALSGKDGGYSLVVSFPIKSIV